MSALDSCSVCSLRTLSLTDGVLGFPLVCIPVCLGHHHCLLLSEKLHQEAGSGDELGPGQLRVGVRALHFQSWDNMRNEPSHVIVGDEVP